MRFFTRISLAFVVFLISFTGAAQNADSLKAFITRNSVALKSIHKNSMRDPSIISDADFRELLKLQVISVKAFDTDKKLSASAAYKVRQKSIGFISVFAPASVSFYTPSDWQTQNFGSAPTLADHPGKMISGSELKTLNGITVKDPTLFNPFRIVVQ